MQQPTKDTPPRIRREKRTVGKMIAMYCRDHHGNVGELCPECAALLDYAMARLDGCAYGEEKPACGHCPSHCYRKSLKEKMQHVMRHAGPRMVWEHPIMAVRHLIDSRRKAPEKPPAK
jgi:hypothetical protein